MLVLLDTHVLIWATRQPERLNVGVAAMFRDPGNTVYFSAASIWEIAIKASLRRADFNADPDQVASDARASGLTELPITAAVASQVLHLPLHHRDPFDRLLIAQAITEPARFYTADAELTRYSDLVHLVR